MKITLEIDPHNERDMAAIMSCLDFIVRAAREHVTELENSKK